VASSEAFPDTWKSVHGSVLNKYLPRAGWLVGIVSLIAARPCARRRRQRQRWHNLQCRREDIGIAKAARGEKSTGDVVPNPLEVTAQVMGVPLTCDFMAVGLVYFTQGAFGLAALAKPYLLKEELHLAPAESTMLLSLTYWPLAMKPIWGFIAYAFPLFGSRRRAYLLLSGLVSAAGWFGLGVGLPGDAKETVLLLMMLGNLGIAVSDVVVDGLVIEKACIDGILMGSLQSFCWVCRGIGAVVSAYFSGALLEAFGARSIFGLTGCLPLLVAVAACLIKEAPVVTEPHRSFGDALRKVSHQMGLLWDLIRSPEILPSALFIVLWQAKPTAGCAMFYYYTNGLHFSAEFLGRTQLSTALASLAGILVYNRVFATMPLRRYLPCASLVTAALGLLPLILISRANLALNIPDQAFVLGDDVVQTVASELSHMPILVLAARLCKPDVQVALFAVLMSLISISGLVASAVGSWLTDVLHLTETDFSNLAMLVVICKAAGILPLVLLRFLPDDDSPAFPRHLMRSPRTKAEAASVPHITTGG